MSEHLFPNHPKHRRAFLHNGIVLLLILAFGLLLTSCQAAVPETVRPGATPGDEAVPAEEAAAPAVTGQLPRNETLYFAGFQWGPPSTFNPLSGDPTWPADGAHQHLYENLFYFNLLTGELDPVLAKELEFVDETTARVTLQDGTTWQDGEPLTVDDVLFTFELAKRNDYLDYSTFWDYVVEMSAVDDRTIEFKLNPERLNPGMFQNFLATERILPRHIWEEIENSGETLTQVVIDEPVGSGPYKVMAFSPERIAMERYDDYWGKELYGLPAPTYIVHPIFKSNDEGNLALQRGEVDLSQQFVPQIWKMWEDNDLPVGTWYAEEPYYVPGSIPLLFVNTHKPGLDNPLVRRALAYSINYPEIADKAMSRYSIPANASLVLPTGGEAQFFNQDLVDEMGWEYNPEEAVRILEEELGATKGADGIYVLPDGTRLGPYTAQTPYGWTDWMTAINLVAQSANDVGIEVRAEFPDAPVVTNHMQQGDFDLALWYVAGVSPASPWLRFRDVMDDRGVPEFGQQAFWNYGRFSHPEVPELLTSVAATSDPAEKKELYGELDRIFIENIPAIPLMYRPLAFYEFNESVWSGFPTEDDPWAPPDPERAATRILQGIEANE